MLFFLSLGKGYKSSTTKEIEGVWGQDFKNLVTIQIDFIDFIELFPLLGHIVKTVNDVIPFSLTGLCNSWKQKSGLIWFVILRVETLCEFSIFCFTLLEIKDTTDSKSSMSHFDTLLEKDVKIKLNNKHDNLK